MNLNWKEIFAEFRTTLDWVNGFTNTLRGKIIIGFVIIIGVFFFGEWQRDKGYSRSRQVLKDIRIEKTSDSIALETAKKRIEKLELTNDTLSTKLAYRDCTKEFENFSKIQDMLVKQSIELKKASLGELNMVNTATSKVDKSIRNAEKLLKDEINN